MKIFSSRCLLLLNLFFITHQIGAKNSGLVEKIKSHKYKIAVFITCTTSIIVYCCLCLKSNNLFNDRSTQFKDMIKAGGFSEETIKKLVDKLKGSVNPWFTSFKNQEIFNQLKKNYPKYFHE